MVQIRFGQFETNSSSTHALILKREAEEALPKVIDLSSDDSIGDYVRKMVRNLNEENTRKLINWLYRKGVTKIIYNGSNSYVNECIKKYKNNVNEDLDIPDLVCYRPINEGALINLLTGHYYEYEGHDDYLKDYDNSETVPYEI